MMTSDPVPVPTGIVGLFLRIVKDGPNMSSNERRAFDPRIATNSSAGSVPLSYH